MEVVAKKNICLTGDGRGIANWRKFFEIISFWEKLFDLKILVHLLPFISNVSIIHNTIWFDRISLFELKFAALIFQMTRNIFQYICAYCRGVNFELFFVSINCLCGEIYVKKT